MLTGLNHIGFELKGSGTVEFRTYNPTLQQDNDWAIKEANASEVQEATELAAKAFKLYRNVPDSDRAQFLRAIAKNIEDLGEELLQVFCKESGLTEDRAIVERTRTCYQLTSLAEMLEKGNWRTTSVDLADPNRQPKPKQDLRMTTLPLGPIVVFGASNFPLAYSTAGGDTASALAAGCPVIVKSHPMHAGTGELVASAIVNAAQETNMPNGVFSNLNSSGIEVGKMLVTNPKIKAVGFTGSERGGRAIMDLAAQREEPIPVFAEMGSINPVVLTTVALKKDYKKWAQTYADSIALGVGQFCTSPGLILGIEDENLNLFAQELAQLLSEKDSGVMLGKSIKESFARNKTEMKSQPGVEELTAVDAASNKADQTILTVSGKHFLNNKKLHQEVFGPFALVVKCADKQELLEIIDGLDGQLTGSIIAENEEHSEVKDVVEALSYRVGRVIWNGVSTGVEVCPSMNHGGPYPASSDSRFTAVGLNSIKRWLRLVSYQSFPNELLPNELK